MFVEIYRDANQEWRWRLVAPNGKIIATSGEGYRRRGAARNAWGKVVGAAAGNPRVVEVLS